MAIIDDWSVTRSNGNIRYVGDPHGGASPSYATVIELHRFLQDLADDASSTGNDEIDITDLLPSDRSTDNIIKLLGIYNIDQTASEHLYDGSIIQGTGITEVIYDGIVNFGNADVQIQIIQNGVVIASDFWNQAGVGLNPSALQGISHRFMIKVRDAGQDIDGRRLIGLSRTFGNTYDEFSINGSTRGNNVLALKDSADLNNTTPIGTVGASTGTWSSVVMTTEGYTLLDVDNDGTDEEYISEWTKGARSSINDLYERFKWRTRDGMTTTIYGIPGELFRGVTHEIPVDTKSGVNFAAFESISWPTGTGQMLAIDSVSAPTKMWIQLLTGVAPVNSDAIDSVATTAACLVNGTVIDRSATINKPAIGTSTGTALLGAYGFGIKLLDLSPTDKTTDLSNTVINPPNSVTFTVAGLKPAEDRVLVAPHLGTDSEGNPAIEKNQLTTTAVAINGAVTSIPVTTAIPLDTPTSGNRTIRIKLTSGKYREVPFTAYSGSAFTIPSTNFSSDPVAASSDVWIAYVDELASGTTAAFSSIFQSSRNLVVLVRDGGIASPIKQFITSATLSSSGGSVTAIRTSDA